MRRREVGAWGRVPLERWGAGVEYQFQKNEWHETHKTWYAHIWYAGDGVETPSPAYHVFFVSKAQHQMCCGVSLLCLRLCDQCVFCVCINVSWFMCFSSAKPSTKCDICLHSCAHKCLIMCVFFFHSCVVNRHCGPTDTLSLQTCECLRMSVSSCECL